MGALFSPKKGGGGLIPALLSSGKDSAPSTAPAVQDRRPTQQRAAAILSPNRETVSTVPSLVGERRRRQASKLLFGE